MLATKKCIKYIINNEILSFWSTIVFTLLGGLILNLLFTYKSGIYPYYFFDYIEIQITVMLILTFLFSIILKIINFNRVEGVLIRIFFSISAPIFMGILLTIIFGNDRMIILMVKQPHVVNILSYILYALIPITIGLVFIKPWKRIINFIIGILYVSIMYTTLLYIGLLTEGIVYNNWL